MNITSPSVFVIEDEKSERISMRLMLEKRGFQVVTAEPILEGKKILREKGYEFDVFVIDMMLNHYPDGNESITGADIILDFFKETPIDKNLNKPEQIILTATPDKIYFYQKAFNLGAAVYLGKSNPSVEVIRHLRALSIKRILNNHIELVDVMENIVLKSRSEAELYENFCIDVLSEIFSKCLGSPFIFLLTESRFPFPLQAKNCIGKNNDLPTGKDSIYNQILSFMYSNAGNSKPFILDDERFDLLDKSESAFTQDQLEMLRNSAFVSLPLANNYSLSIGIIKDENLYSEPPDEMARLLINFVNYPAIMFLAEITARWHKSVTERDTTIKRLATFCNNVGSEQLYILEDADLVNKESDKYLDSKIYQHIKGLAEDLRQTGRLLEPIADRSFSSQPLPLLSMKDLINGAWKELESEADFGNKIDISVTGDCQVQGEKEDFWLVAFRLLHWLSRRRFEIPNSIKHSIKVTCSEDENEAVIVFEDNSYRLPEELRERLFNAFSPATPPPTSDDISEKHKPGLYLALYLSQIIVEEKYRGKLRECSDDLTAKLGHKIEIRIPLSK